MRVNICIKFLEILEKRMFQYDFTNHFNRGLAILLVGRLTFHSHSILKIGKRRTSLLFKIEQNNLLGNRIRCTGSTQSNTDFTKRSTNAKTQQFQSYDGTPTEPDYTMHE